MWKKEVESWRRRDRAWQFRREELERREEKNCGQDSVVKFEERLVSKGVGKVQSDEEARFVRSMVGLRWSLCSWVCGCGCNCDCILYSCGGESVTISREEIEGRLWSVGGGRSVAETVGRAINIIDRRTT